MDSGGCCWFRQDHCLRGSAQRRCRRLCCRLFCGHGCRVIRCRSRDGRRWGERSWLRFLWLRSRGCFFIFSGHVFRFPRDGFFRFCRFNHGISESTRHDKKIAAESAFRYDNKACRNKIGAIASRSASIYKSSFSQTQELNNENRRALLPKPLL